jgi:hypothetical protein
MRKLLNRKIASQNRKCGLCGAEFTDYSDVVPDHMNPRGMGGHGETIILTTFRLSTGGAMAKKVQQESNLDQGIEIDMEFPYIRW